MKITKEISKLIATRVPPGDKWSLVGDPKNEIYNSITNTLEAYFTKTNFKGEYRLSPLEGKLYVIELIEELVPEDKPKTYSLYGEFKQGI